VVVYVALVGDIMMMNIQHFTAAALAGLLLLSLLSILWFAARNTIIS
jgi:hypothetical protein